ncbi:MAG: hypothetical protein NTW86_32940 [Candidatus Sumerlaeota bacterium]|nr:hypothetical protein [Candidatus Sumerlaeota bacterium]
MELAALFLAVAGFALVAVPLCDSFTAAVEFANRPAHRVTLAPPWTFFDREFRRRLRKWVVVWLLIFPVNVGVVALADTRGHWSWDTVMTRGHAYIGLQCGFFTLSAIFLEGGIVVVLAPKLARKGYLVATSIALAIALFALIIFLAGLLPPTIHDQIHTASQLRAEVRLYTGYVWTAFALLVFCAGAWSWFMAVRKNLRLFTEEV